MKKFIKLVRIEFKRIFSNDVLLAIFFGAPILYGFLFGYVYQQAKVVDLPIVIIDQDRSPTTDKIIDAFEDNEGLLVTDVRYSAGNIIAEMPLEQYAAVITLPTNFEADVFQKRHPEIRVDLNMANILNAKDRKSTRLNSSHVRISYAVFCLKKKKNKNTTKQQ